MLNEIDDENMDIKSSLDSQNIDKDISRDNDIDLPKSRLSSASSKKHQEQRSVNVNNSFSNESFNEIRIKSANSFHQNRNQLSNNKLTNENQSIFDSLHHEEQSTNNNPLNSSIGLIGFDTDRSNVDQIDSMNNSLNVETNDNDSLPSRQRKTRASNYIFFISVFLLYIYICFFFEEDDKFPNLENDKEIVKQSTTEHPACQFHTGLLINFIYLTFYFAYIF